jgi:predicted nucleic acid-binding Zn ribbon protein
VSRRKGAVEGGTAGAPAGRSREPRRIGEVLHPALARLQGSDQARAYTAWAQATGAQVAGGARARAFQRGVLTVECSSSVWASELTYLSDQILARMRELAPNHPVQRLRFMVASSPARPEQQPPAAKPRGRRDSLTPAQLSAARTQASQVRDERLRAAILATLEATAREASQPSGDDAH